ncbi:T9SS type B sorting domain-containing protein [Cloacibacterium normanense]
MKKLFTFLLFLFFITKIFAQFDTEHWFAPIADASGGSEAQQYIYVSTNESTPFNVEIYSNNSIIGTISNLSKGNPQKFYIPREYIITTKSDEINSKTSLGLHLIGEKKFFANIRFSVFNHAEIITSKGKSALGNHFFIGMGEQYIPNDIRNIRGINAVVSVIATEDNTTVKLSGYNKDVIFSDSSTDDEKVIVLKKGESYIFETLVADTNANLEGLIGSTITSDKPISVTNGNFLSVAENKGNYDVLMDQSVPIERIGTEYVILKGNGTANGLNEGYTEKTLVIATEDDTQVFVNESNIPISLNKGQYHFIRGGFYNPSNNIFNLYIKSTKPIYVYQFLAGTDGTDGTPEFATGGFNFIPALSCYLPNNIDEIGSVNEMPYRNSFAKYKNTKLNIITEKGATVSINGVPISSSYGPFALSGNSAWETYVVPNVSDNISIKSNKAVTAGIASGNGAVGYGGYFAGFNSVPIISKGGDCEKGNVTLEVDNTYDGYQWYYNGNPYTGSGANTYIITPTESGDYYVKISKSSCGSLDSPIFKFQRCPFKTTLAIEVSDCTPTYKITPKFSTSTQTIDIRSIKITKAPSYGTASIDATTGEITYTLTDTTVISDTFTYSFSGTDPNYPDTEFVTVNIIVNRLKTITVEALACIKPDKTGDFDLTQAKVSNDTNITKVEYFENYDAATKTFSNLIANFTNYNSVPKTIYSKVTNRYGCTEMAEINLNFYPIPNIDTLKFDSTLCDTDFDGLYEPDFDEISKTIVNNSADFDIYYFDNPGFNFPALPKNWTYTTPTRIYILVASRNGCTNATGFLDFKIGNKLSVTDATSQICDGDFNNTEVVNLDTYLPQLTSETGYTHQFYLTKNDADLEQNPISASQNLTSTTTFYVRIKKSGICDNIAALTLNFGQPNTSTTLPAQVTVCEGSTTTLDAGTGFTSYLWSNGATTQTITVGKGDYSVLLTSPNSCTYTQNVKVVESPKAIVDISKFNTTICDQNLDGTIEVNLNNVTAAILLNPGIYRVKYYTNITDANAGKTNILNNFWSFSTDTTIFARVESDYCPVQIYPLDFKFGNRVTVLTSTLSQEVCDDDLDAIKSVNLKTFESFFTADNSVSITYFYSENDAKNNINPISSTQNITSRGTYFLRFEKANSCPNWAKITVNIKTPKASTTLQNKTICKNTTTVVDAGTGFTYYKWSNGTEGATLQTATYGVGTHYVELTSTNGCVYKQSFTISEAVDPVIDSVIEQGNSITVNVSGGTAPYEYSLDQINWQKSNFFDNLRRGVQKVYVRDANICTPIEYEFAIINLINAITPNGDGINDVLDYSDLRVKKDVKISIFDRFGKKVYSSEKQSNYIWNGTENGRSIITGTYWYVLEWTEPDTNTKVTYKNWIIVKNRN